MTDYIQLGKRVFKLEPLQTEEERTTRKALETLIHLGNGSWSTYGSSIPKEVQQLKEQGLVRLYKTTYLELSPEFSGYPRLARLTPEGRHLYQSLLGIYKNYFRKSKKMK